MMLTLFLALAAERALPPTSVCYYMAIAVRAGDIVDPTTAYPGPCPEAAVPTSLVYDRRAAVARAAVDLEPDAPLGAVYLPAAPAVLPGERIALTQWIGRVKISREVTAIQAGKLGQRLFVRDDSGAVFTAPLPGQPLRRENQP